MRQLEDSVRELERAVKIVAERLDIAHYSGRQAEVQNTATAALPSNAARPRFWAVIVQGIDERKGNFCAVEIFFRSLRSYCSDVKVAHPE